VLAVNVDVKLARDLRDPLDRNPFRAVALVQKRRDNRKSRFFGNGVHVESAGIIPQLGAPTVRD
jgi:hypothetical protein